MISNRFLIISHTPHYRKNNQIVGWGPTVTEIDHLASLFKEVVHLAPLHLEVAPNSSLEYQSKNVRLSPITSGGGDSIFHKMKLLIKIPGYIYQIVKELRKADAVQIRCPANISLIAIVILAFIKNPKKRWIKYAGNWKPEGKEASSYSFQRWWLTRNFHRGVVTINGMWPNQPNHIVSFHNPCLTEEDITAGQKSASGKELQAPYQMLFVGAVIDYKGVDLLIPIARALKNKNLSFKMDIVGDGPARPHLEKAVQEEGLGQEVDFHGWLPKTQLGNFYQKAQFLIIPSRSEGWPKVISEAMAYGVVPVASKVSSIPYYFNQFQIGTSVDPNNPKAFAQAIEDYVNHPKKWSIESKNATIAASHFTYNRYLDAVKELLNL